jgi:hypothetical protein
MRQPHRPALIFGPDEIRAFVNDVKTGCADDLLY